MKRKTRIRMEFLGFIEAMEQGGLGTDPRPLTPDP